MNYHIVIVDLKGNFERAVSSMSPAPEELSFQIGNINHLSHYIDEKGTSASYVKDKDSLPININNDTTYIMCGDESDGDLSDLVGEFAKHGARTIVPITMTYRDTRAGLASICDFESETRLPNVCLINKNTDILDLIKEPKLFESLQNKGQTSVARAFCGISQSRNKATIAELIPTLG